jgi:hypothetical protein
MKVIDAKVRYRTTGNSVSGRDGADKIRVVGGGRKVGNCYAKEIDVMCKEVVVRVGGRRSVLSVLVLGCILAGRVSSFALQSVTLAWDPSADTNVVGYNIYYGVASRTYTNHIDVGNTLTATVSNLVEGTTYYFAATAYNGLGMESDYSNETSWTAPWPGGNQPPTLNAISNLTINEDAAQQTVGLSGITSGATNEIQTLAVTASSSDTGLIPHPTVNYTSPNATGTLTFTPVANAYGSATISVTVNDGQATNNTVTRTFTVTVNAVNDSPTLNAISNLTINEDAGQQTVNLSGISSGAANESQTLTVTASSSNTGLIPNPTVSYTSPNATGTLTFTPVANANGSATITVIVNDGQASNNTVTRTFTVTVNAVNDPPTLNAIGNLALNQNAGLQTVNLSGITSGATNESQTLTVTASSSNTGLIPHPTVSYASPNTTGTLTFTPVAGASGSATVTVTVNDGQATNNTLARTFNVTVNGLPFISSIADQTIGTNSSAGPISFTIGDAETPAASLVLRSASSMPSLIPTNNILFGGSGSNRTVTLTPLAGQSGSADITITVSDGSQNGSTVFRLNVLGTPTPPDHLIIITNGAGIITPDLSGQQLVNGNTYTITAVPAEGNIFAGWSGSFISTNPRLTFQMTSNLVIEANFIPNPFLGTKGTYVGLFHESDEVQLPSSGYFTVSVTAKGKYSGRLQLGTRRHSFKGALNLQCQGTNLIWRRTGGALALNFQIVGDQADQIHGQLSDGIWSASLAGNRAVFHARTNPAPCAGSYTMAVPGLEDDAFGPTGFGHGRVKVSPSGKLKFVGSLADGTKVSQSTMLSRDGCWPLYASPYSGNGLVLSWLIITNRAQDDINGSLCWIKWPIPTARYYPGGFTNECLAVGSIYSRPVGMNILDETGAQLEFTGGNLGPGFTNIVTLDAASRVFNTSSNALSMKFSLGNGTFKGKVKDPVSGRTSSFRGAILQKMGAGYGYLPGTNLCSRVILAP